MRPRDARTWSLNLTPAVGWSPGGSGEGVRDWNVALKDSDEAGLTAGQMLPAESAGLPQESPYRPPPSVASAHKTLRQAQFLTSKRLFGFSCSGS